MKDRASYLGTVSLNFLQLPGTIGNWQSYETEDIFATNFINVPHEHLYTMGSGINPLQGTALASLATIPNFQLPTQTQWYIAGRTVVRWGGTSDPTEVDIDHYGFTPVFNKGVAVVWKAPKSEPHHLSQIPDLINTVPSNLVELVEAIRKGEFK